MTAFIFYYPIAAAALVVMPQVYVISGVIRFARGGCPQRLFQIAEETHAKTRVGVPDDGISYQVIINHLQFKLVFKGELQAEDFKIKLKKIPQEYLKWKSIVLDDDAVCWCR